MIVEKVPNLNTYILLASYHSSKGFCHQNRLVDLILNTKKKNFFKFENDLKKCQIDTFMVATL